MELSVVEETPKKLAFELKGEGHTLCNILKSELWAGKHVKSVAYTMAHPLIGAPRIVVETDGELKPRKAIADAAEALRKKMAEFRQELKKFRW